jgi:hypothetical protein
MGQSMPLFPRQTVVGTGLAYWSDPFEVSAFEALNLQLRVFGVIGTNVVILVRIETAAELSVVDGWTTVHTFSPINMGPQTQAGSLTAADLSQYVRASVEMQMGTDVAMTFSLIGVAREG